MQNEEELHLYWFSFSTPHLTMLCTTTRYDWAVLLEKCSPTVILFVPFLPISFKFCCNFPTVALLTPVLGCAKCTAGEKTYHFPTPEYKSLSFPLYAFGWFSLSVQLKIKVSIDWLHSLYLELYRALMHFKFHTKKAVTWSLNCFCCWTTNSSIVGSMEFQWILVQILSFRYLLQSLNIYSSL